MNFWRATTSTSRQSSHHKIIMSTITNRRKSTEVGTFNVPSTNKGTGKGTVRRRDQERDRGSVDPPEHSPVKMASVSNFTLSLRDSARRSNNNPKGKARQTNYVAEQILKDFVTYLRGIHERFRAELIGSDDWDSSARMAKLLEWTTAEAEKHKERLKFFGRALGDQMRRLPRENKVVRSILEAMKAAIREGIGGEGRRHVVVLLENTVKLLKIVQPVDLNKLTALMETNQRAGDCMDNKDVVLLLGSSGSGKTTTLHQMAGTSFEEAEVDGFFHLKPTEFVNPAVANYKTTPGGEIGTHTIQTVEISVDGRNVVICDTPAFGAAIATGLEDDIANGLGIVRALHRAHSVRPVLVLSREGMGDRFNAFSETLSSVTRLLGNTDKIDLKPFNYIFTKYEKRHAACKCRQFILIRKRPQPSEMDNIMFQAFVDDIIQKTTPEAKIALPMEEAPLSLLRKILYDHQVVKDPSKYFIPFVSDSALRKLKLQLQITLRDVLSAIGDEDFGLAVYRMKQLSRLALYLPEANECAQLGMENCLRYIHDSRDDVCNVVEHLQEVQILKQYSAYLEALRRGIDNIMLSEKLRSVCADFEKQFPISSTKKKVPLDGEVFCTEQVLRLARKVNQDIPKFDPKYLNTENLMKQRGSFLAAVVRLKEMSEILCDVPGSLEIATMYIEAFDRFYAFVENLLSEAEEKFDTSPKDIQSFERQAWFLSVLIQGFLNKPNSGTGEHEKMEKLENRRLQLILRLDHKIADTIELINNTKFPGFENLTNDDARTIQEGECLPLVKVSGLHEPRRVLVSVSRLPRLGKLLPSKLEISEVEKAIEVLDEKIVNYLWSTTITSEAILHAIEKEKLKNPDKALSNAIVLRHDLNSVAEEFTAVRKWSSLLEEETNDSWARLIIVQDSMVSSIKGMEEHQAQLQRSLGFTCGVLPSSYLCANPKSVA